MIKVIGCDERVTATSKKISFTYEGENYLVALYWDAHSGYELNFMHPSYVTPEWAINWEDDHLEDDSLYTVLDNLSDEVLA